MPKVMSQTTVFIHFFKAICKNLCLIVVFYLPGSLFEQAIGFEGVQVLLKDSL